jgi:ribosomal protein S18 acetylase RimI-like enzyme
MAHVRAQADEDIDAVAAVQVAAWRAAYRGIMPAAFLAGLDPAAVARWRRALPPTVRTLLAVEGDVVVGFATFGPAGSGGGAGQVFALYVHPDRWGCGHGRALLTAALGELRGHAEVHVWVAEENHPARRFYERMGLAADGERAVEDIGGAVPVVRYVVRLPQRHEEQQGDADPDVEVAADEADRP